MSLCHADPQALSESSFSDVDEHNRAFCDFARCPDGSMQLQIGYEIGL